MPPSARWSTLTAEPVEPTFRVVDFTGVNSVAKVVAGPGAGAGAGVVDAISAFQTLASVTPVTGRPFDFWYSLTRPSVSRPYEPSTASLPIAFCRALTASPRDHSLRVSFEYFARGLVVGAGVVGAGGGGVGGVGGVGVSTAPMSAIHTLLSVTP